MLFNKLHRRTVLKGILGFLPVSLSRLARATERLFKVTLSEAHVGNLEIDTKLLDSYGKLPNNIRQFYLDARAVFAAESSANFTDARIVAAAKEHGLPLMGGPLLGDVSSDSICLWIRPASSAALKIKFKASRDADTKSVSVTPEKPGVELRIRLVGLSPQTDYAYTINTENSKIAEGKFTTAPTQNQPCKFRVVFGSCFHKIGLHNPGLIREILKRKPSAMLIYGDIAVDDRNNEINMHRADYQLRDVSKAWRDLASNVPLYTSWDDHDYFDNDLSGVPPKFDDRDREAVREVWRQNWNNPATPVGRKGIYFNTRIGPAELIMLDTRSCRERHRRGQYGSYLGEQQLDWLKQTLRESTAPFKVISSGTMWSDYISNGKDSWGTWDKKAREEIFEMIGNENIGGVLLVSGDRHGARGFKIPRETGYDLYEFEPATLGGVHGPEAMAKNATDQLFGYDGKGLIAFGEFSIDTTTEDPSVTFRLIKETGEILEEHTLMLFELSN